MREVPGTVPKRGTRVWPACTDPSQPRTPFRPLHGPKILGPPPRLCTLAMVGPRSKFEPVVRDLVGLATAPQPRSLETYGSCRIRHQVSLRPRNIANTMHFGARPGGVPCASCTVNTPCKPCTGSCGRVPAPFPNARLTVLSHGGHTRVLGSAPQLAPLGASLALWPRCSLMPPCLSPPLSCFAGAHSAQAA